MFMWLLLRGEDPEAAARRTTEYTDWPRVERMAHRVADAAMRVRARGETPGA